jgi:hypothetical protein
LIRVDRRAIAAAMYRWKADLVAIVSVVVCLGRIGAASAAEPTLHLEGKGTLECIDAVRNQRPLCRSIRSRPG